MEVKMRKDGENCDAKCAKEEIGCMSAPPSPRGKCRDIYLWIFLSMPFCHFLYLIISVQEPVIFTD